MTKKEMLKLINILLKRLRSGQSIEPESKHEEILVKLAKELSE